MAGVELLSEVRAAIPMDVRERRDDYWTFLERLLLGLVRYRDGVIYGLGIPLIRTGEPHFRDGDWVWPVTGGLLAERPGGEIGYGAREGRLVGFLRGYHPLLPAPLYDLTQKPVHQAITRLFLLNELGRRHPPGLPAAPALRLAAGAVDSSLVLLASRLIGRRRSALLGAAYLTGSWMAGGTLGMRVFGMRLTSIDGSRVTAGQAVVRLLALPMAALKLRALHDEIAGTEVVEG